MIYYNNTIPAIFVRRINRFVAEVEIPCSEAVRPDAVGIVAAGNMAAGNMAAGKKERVHVKNTGRLKELLVPGAKVTLQKAGNPDRKTAYDLISVYKQGLEWVNIDSLAPNELMKQYLMDQDYDLVKPEFTYGDSRFDFYMEKQGEKYLTEVKGCTLAADLEQGIGLFPDAPTERGVKHLDELAAAVKKGYTCEIAFVIQMNGIRRVLPNDGTHPEFGEALVRAVKAGVKVSYYGCHVEADRIEITEVIHDEEA